MAVTINGTSGYIADFSNATVASRQAFQTSTANSTTGIYALPNGTSTAASWQASNAADPTNASKILIATNGSTDVQLVSGRNGTGTYLPLTFYTNGSEQMRLDTSGNLGLGVTPSAWNSGFKALQIGQGAAFQGQTNSYSVVHLSGNAYVDSGGTYRYIGAEAAQRYRGYAGAHEWYTAPSGTAGNAITFTQAMTLDASGNLGVGTSSPAARLNISGGDAYFYNTATYGGIRIGYDGSNYWAIQRENASTGRLGFFNGASEKVSIDSSGNLLVGTTSQISSGKQTTSFSGATHNGLVLSESANTSSSGYIYFNNGLSTIGSISRVGATSAVAYNTTSDQRLKSNIENASPVLEKLMQVQVRQYDWTDGDLHQDYGFIAQEINSVLSGVVTQGKTEEDMWQLDYSKLTPHLVKAIQEQQAIITQLQADIETLKQKVV